MRLYPLMRKELAYYEVDGNGDWSNVPIVNRSLDSDKVNLNANYASNDNSGYSVSSSLRDCLMKRTPERVFFITKKILSNHQAVSLSHTTEIPLVDIVDS